MEIAKGKISNIQDHIAELMHEIKKTQDEQNEYILSYIAEILCEINPSVALEVMEEFKELDGVQNIIRGINVRHGF